MGGKKKAARKPETILPQLQAGKHRVHKVLDRMNKQELKVIVMSLVPDQAAKVADDMKKTALIALALDALRASCQDYSVPLLRKLFPGEPDLFGFLRRYPRLEPVAAALSGRGGDDLHRAVAQAICQDDLELDLWRALEVEGHSLLPEVDEAKKHCP